MLSVKFFTLPYIYFKLKKAILNSYNKKTFYKIFKK